MTPELQQRFTKLFKGLDRAYGKYELPKDLIATDGEKVKGRGITKSEDLLPEHYTRHLLGQSMLGVVPIQDGNRCNFAAIDIDDYEVDHVAVIKRVSELKLPLVATRSKSGGLHLWAFFKNEGVPARAAMTKLEEVSAALGYPGIEIFPKQHQIGPEDVGNWINLPWFQYDETDRWGWTDEGEEIRDLETWLGYAEDRAVTLKELNRWKVDFDDAGEADAMFADGPPCLQTLASRGIPEGQRNMTMFPMAVYAHARYPDPAEMEWAVHQYNDHLFDPRMQDREIETIRQQVEHNDYRYPCQQEPIKSVCNRALCLRRKYGVRLNGTQFNWGTLWQILPLTNDGKELVDECYWRMQLNYNEEQVMIDLSTAELMNYRAVHMKVVNARIILPPMDANDWRNIIEEKMQNVEVVHELEITSSVGELRQHLARFLSMRAAGTEMKVEVLAGKAWLNEDEGMFWFQGEFFKDYLTQQRYTDFKGPKLTQTLKHMFGFDITRARFPHHENPVRIWKCPKEMIDPAADILPPDVKETF